MKPKILLVFSFILFTHGLYAQTNGETVTAESIDADMQMHSCKQSERLENVRTIFRKMGAVDGDFAVDEKGRAANLYVTVKGRSEETIILGAHYDKVSDGCGAIDNWSGIVILANIYNAIKARNPEKTYIFAAFDKEEKGLIGSRAMARTIPKAEKPRYCAMVNMDSFGFNYPQVLSNASTKKLTKFARELADEVKMPFSEASLAGTADADSTSFVQIKIPAITFHGLSNKWPEYLHSSKDKIDNVNPTSVLIGFRFLSLFLERLDTKACDAFRE